jgi:hypothetical protein
MPLFFTHPRKKPKGIDNHFDSLVKIPLISIGPSGIGGEYQRER